MPILDKIMRAPRPLVIIAENVEGTALSMLVHNHVNGVFQCLAVRAPGFGDRRLHKLEDIAAITGGAVYSRQSGFTPGDHDARAARPGRAGPGERRPDRHHRRRAARRTTWIPAHPAARRAATGPTFGIDEDVLTERIGALSGKVAVIRVGAPTNAELKELQHRVEDALSATRAAMAEGIVAGGGAALLHAEPALDDLEVKDDYATGVGIVRRVLTAPAFLIATNAGYSGEEVVTRLAELGPDEGFDALEGRYGNMIEMGIIDPLRVARVGAPERRVGRRPAAHHQHAGRRGADAVGRQRGPDDRVRPAGRGPAPALARRQHAAVAGPRPVCRLSSAFMRAVLATRFRAT